ncbi:hypothetical protein Ocin01_07804 [Orchesella cincta]|uniref:Bacteriophage T5 Orf172 DNA-binding domain-containing protein n=1 Tax=Orchesella cincta TaxID=48709 RepID=A0A1D2N0S6_ORCCI|nr:hypothetical protein Ocin01_07804 [Orchesella cincta]
MVCGICSKSGHNRRTCPSKLATQNGSPEPNNPVMKKVIGSSSHSPSVRNYSTAPEAVRDIKQKITFSNDIQNDYLDFKELLSKLKTSRQAKEYASSSNEVETTEKNRKKVENKEKTPSESFVKPKPKPKKLGINWLNPEALQRLEKGPTKEDGPGHIYMYKIKNPTPEEINCYKIGLSKNLPDKRIHAQEVANKKIYEAVITWETPYRYLTETTIHRQLKSQRTPRSYGDGKTEWFTGDRDTFIDIINRVIREVNGQKSVWLD